MIAFADGKPIEFRWSEAYLGSRRDREWKVAEYSGNNGPLWNFTEFDYRPKPEPKTRPWSKPSDVPLSCWVRRKHTAWECLVVMVNHGRIAFIDGQATTIIAHEYEKLSEFDYSTDRINWNPCTCEVTE